MSTNITPIEVAATPPAAGLTTKVVKGSVWTLAGQVLPLAATIVTTPIVIRLLGAEGYGVLILVGLIPMYFSFADFGMGVASTRFGSGAYAQGDVRTESQVVWTAAAIAFFTSLAFAVPIFIFSGYLIEELRVPPAMQFEGTVALRITTAAFVVGLLANVFNTPQLSRLRMDLNSLIGGGSRTLLSLLTPVVLYFGGGIIGAAALGLVIAVLTLAAHIAVSGILLSELLHASLNRALLRPMLKFGAGLLVSGIAAVFLTSFEKVMLPRLVSVESLAFYSVAFTFANMATMYSIAMIQSLVPAFSQLLEPERRPQFQSLFSRSIRFNLIVLLPVIVFLFVIARPFFTFWAGPDFGRESTLPFHILLVGLSINIVAFVPHSALTALGRTDIFAKLYWVELVFYVAAVLLLVSIFQEKGAAIAWSSRCIIDALVILWIVNKTGGIKLSLRRHFSTVLIGFLTLSPVVMFAVFYDNFSLLLLFFVPLCILGYSILIWAMLLEHDEKHWLTNELQTIRRRFVF